MYIQTDIHISFALCSTVLWGSLRLTPIMSQHADNRGSIECMYAELVQKYHAMI